MTHSKKTPDLPALSQKLVSWLFREVPYPFTFLESIKILSARFFIKNRVYLDEYFKALAAKIEATYNDETITPLTKELILYSALSYLGYTDPRPGTTLKINDIEYTIEKIPLTSGWFSGAYCAYGLKASNDAASILIFKGTTFPTDGGFFSAHLADTRPHGAVGSLLYAQGQDVLQVWITNEHQRTKKKVICTGQSLGGAMSLHCHIHQPALVDFFAIHPPSMTSREKRLYDNINSNPSSGEQRLLKVVCHRNDPVFNVGSQYLPPGTSIYNHGDKHSLPYFAHIKTPDCSQEPIFNDYPDTIKRNWGWKFIKPILFLTSLLLHLVVWPLRLLIKTKETIEDGVKENHSKARSPRLTDPSVQGGRPLGFFDYRPIGSKVEAIPPTGLCEPSEVPQFHESCRL